ncbi:hypothetical protein ACPFT2_003614, partial [Vibrio cholerae]
LIQLGGSVYTKKCVAFIDILGFGALVEQSENDLNIVENIHRALMSMSTKSLKDSVEPELNIENIPAGKVKDARRTLDYLTTHIKRMYSLEISYFSDCVVISADAENSMSCQMLFDTIGKFALRLWGENNLVLRGGVTIGNLHHTENGPVFGPAMNRAYQIESKEAVTPRLLIDRECYEHLSQSRTFSSIEAMFVEDSGQVYCSLASYYKHYRMDPTVHWDKLGLNPTLDSLKVLLEEKIELLTTQNVGESVLEKYRWLISQC